ncbi:hypothetical protein ACHAWF_004660 [Thalassiosira exigua]
MRESREKIGAATGSHYALVAVKGAASEGGSMLEGARIDDQRFLPNGEYAIEDTHLKPWALLASNFQQAQAA